MQRSGVKVPQEIVEFFAKISIYLKIRHLNNAIKIKKRKREIGKDRGIARKKKGQIMIKFVVRQKK